VSLIIRSPIPAPSPKVKAAIEAAYREGEAKLKGSGKTVPALSAFKTPLRDGDSERRTTRRTQTVTFSRQQRRCAGHCG
jgi:hypothetical protein